MMLLDIFFGPYHVITASVIYLALTIYSVFLVFNKEHGITRLLWIIMILFLPIIVSLIYLMGSLVNWFLKKRKRNLLTE